MIFSTTSAEVLDHDLEISTHHALIKQMVYALMGSLCGYAVFKAGYLKLLKFSPLLLVVFSLLLLCVFIPGIGKEVNGSRRWVNLAGFSFQPSEFVKYIVPLYFVFQMRLARGNPFTFHKFLKLLVPVAIPLVLILIEPNNGTAAVVMITVVMLFFLTQVPLKYWALPLGCFVLCGALFASQLPYVSGRLKVYLNPELDLRGRGHQPHQAKIVAGSGQLLGKGPGQSWQKLSYLPEAQNDYIAAIYAEEFGFLGMALLITLYMVLALLGFHVASGSSDREGFYIASFVTFLITFQAFLNLGVVSGLLPSTGLNLPFFSQGGTSLIANLMGGGLLLSVKRTAPLTNKI